MRFDNAKARDILQASLSLDVQNQDALEYLAKTLCVQQDYAEAHEKLLGLKHVNEKDLQQFCLTLSQSGFKKPLSVQQLYPFVVKTLRGGRYILKSQIFAWAIMKSDSLEKIESDVSWLLSTENGKKVHCKVQPAIGGFYLDLSANSSLNDIRSIGQMPIRELDLRGCKVNHQGFPGSFPKTEKLLINKNHSVKKQYFKEVDIIRF